MNYRGGISAAARLHIVLIPGFGGFDALGQVEYYSGITPVFEGWRQTAAVNAVLHYFDNLPTAAVRTRAARLRKYLAKRIARGEIQKTDRVVLVGHSTGGLDIRQLIWDLADSRHGVDLVDGGAKVFAADIRNCLEAVVFLSVPHWGTNIADWVHGHGLLRKTTIADLGLSFKASQVSPIDRIESGITDGAAQLTGANLLLALKDAVTEANEHYGNRDATRLADAQEAASQLELYLHQMATDCHAIEDLTSRVYDRHKASPANFSANEHKDELTLWRDPPIRTFSYATVGPRVFDFQDGCPAGEFELKNPLTYPEIQKNWQRSADTDFVYRFCYRACAGGPFRRPVKLGRITRIMGTPPKGELQLWDNDGIVNTISMLWPDGPIVLVAADHLDVVGHYQLIALVDNELDKGCKPARIYRSYDSLKSGAHFTTEMFNELWTGIFNFAANPKAAGAGSGHRRETVKVASAAAGRRAS